MRPRAVRSRQVLLYLVVLERTGVGVVALGMGNSASSSGWSVMRVGGGRGGQVRQSQLGPTLDPGAEPGAVGPRVVTGAPVASDTRYRCRWSGAWDGAARKYL